jgi:hypothetical protein
MKLHLGVSDFPHPVTPGKTTGDVAQHLEDRYQLFSAFVDRRAGKIGDIVAEQMGRSISAMVHGRPTKIGPPGRVSLVEPAQAALDEVGRLFKSDILADSYRDLAGVPTLAAQLGIRHDLKNPRGTPTAELKAFMKKPKGERGYWPFKKGYKGGRIVIFNGKRYWAYRPERASFFDAGTVASAAKAWVTGKD